MKRVGRRGIAVLAVAAVPLVMAGCAMPDPVGERQQASSSASATNEATAKPSASATDADGRSTGQPSLTATAVEDPQTAAPVAPSPAAPADAAQVRESADGAEFASPSGGIFCSMYEGLAACMMTGERPASWDVPPVSQACPGEQLTPHVNTVTVDADGPAWACYGGVVAYPTEGSPGVVWNSGGFGSTTTVGGVRLVALPYGKGLRQGGVTCTSRENGVTCLNGSGEGFNIRRADVTFY